MKVLIINSGSSSIKFKLLDMPSETMVCTGLVERIGASASQLSYSTGDTKILKSHDLKNHRQGLEKVVEILMDSEVGVIARKEEIEVVGHRVVHGGKTFSETVEINGGVKKEIEEFSTLAPLHNPPNLEGILVAEELFPQATQIAVFDTAFHRSIPQKAKRYAIPDPLYVEHGIQVYGFHGISHEYVSKKANDYLRLQRSKIITIHLGNGCSMTAVKNRESVDHSMGFSPNEGLIMGTRSGDIDQGVIFHLISHLGYDPEEVNTLLTKQSGMLGLTGYSDLRDIESRALAGDTVCTLALEMNAYRIRKYIGAYAAAMNGLDALVFTAGIGENSSKMRKLICADMEFLGIDLDEDKNDIKSDQLRSLNSTTSKVQILVVPTNEELEIAKQAYRLKMA
ncbi:acetate kinase [Membranicola marinus]|uniref:Acetate kinase n=1 Tax=Membranihabitans marinus TaxID=1227546 RepID=A0A953HNS6_9BACT|nr:acetate kinase [Membranihabitans marinus]MBY5959002.1 acetate kinase [Membranihabitans marinus]